MKLLTRSLVAALALAFGYGGSALAGDSCGCGDMLAGHSWNACGDCCYDGCCDPCGRGAGGIGFFGEAEVLFLRYHRADGVRVGSDPGEQAEFDFDPAMRYTAGLIGPGGMGARIRYFDFDHTALSADGLGQIGVDLWNIDIEAFEAFALNDVWALEVSGGIRFTNFREQMLDLDGAVLEDRRIGVDAVGGIVGLEARRATGLGVLYARSRFAIIQGDKQLFNTGDAVTPAPQAVELLDVTTSVLELAIGSELNYQLGNGAVLFGRSGLEWQQYHALSSAFGGPPGAAEEYWQGDSDVGFGGFTFAAGVSY